MASKYMLSTIDNPYNPFEEFPQWLLYDKERHYDSIDILGRVARTSDQLSDQENDAEIERAIDDIIKYDVTNQFIKVTVDSFKQKE